MSRGLGSLAYAVLCVVLGRVSASVGVEWVLPINMVFLAGLIVAVLLFLMGTAELPSAFVVAWLWPGSQGMMVMALGLGGVAGNPVSGFLIDLGGVRRLLMIYCVAVGVLSVLVACAALRWTKKRSAS